MFWTNFILLLSLVIMFATAVYLFRDGEGKGPAAGPGIRSLEDEPGDQASDDKGQGDDADNAVSVPQRRAADSSDDQETMPEVRVRVTQVEGEATPSQRETVPGNSAPGDSAQRHFSQDKRL